MEIQALKAEVRNTRGKGPARQLRMRGLIPAVFYGPGKTTASISVDPIALTKALSGPYARNQLVELNFGSTKELALVRDVAIDPLTRAAIHVDFYAAALDRPVRGEVPFEATGRAVGVQQGGVLRKIYRSLPVTGLPNKIPAKVVVDVTNLDLHQSIKTKDIPLPESVSILFPAERSLVAVTTKEKELPEEDGAAAPGAAAAPAAAAAKGAPAKAAAPAPAKKK